MPDEEHSLRKYSPAFVIPAGSQVVLKNRVPLSHGDGFRKPGAVGVVVRCPPRADGDYLVEFADGKTARAPYPQLALRRREVDMELEGVTEDLRKFVIYQCQVGSRAFGLAGDHSDDDLRGIYLPPARLDWSLFSLPGQIESNENGSDEVYWELEKFVRLALKANPNILETLWTPLVLKADPVARQLREIRDCFLSKHLYKTYSGYVLSQFRRMKNRYDRTGDYKKKHAMHLVRLLISGIAALEGAGILIDVGSHRDELLAIRQGERSFAEIRNRALQLERQFQQAFDHSGLPEQPDYRRVDDFLIAARRGAV